MADPNAGIFTLIYVVVRGTFEIVWGILLLPLKMLFSKGDK